MIIGKDNYKSENPCAVFSFCDGSPSWPPI
jgi:hypothetical protein